MRWVCWRNPATISRLRTFGGFGWCISGSKIFWNCSQPCLVAYMFVLLGVVDERIALRMIYLDIILYSAGGMVGTMHHVYFSGEPALHMALGAFFSAAEVIPLTFLTLEAWSFLAARHGAGEKAKNIISALLGGHVSRCGRVSGTFLAPVVFGFLINLPIVSYYEIGTALTANHGHAAMMGVYGMLGGWSCALLLALHYPGRTLVRQSGTDQLLVAKSWTGLDGVRDAVSAGNPATLSLHQCELLRRAHAQLYRQSC